MNRHWPYEHRHLILTSLIAFILAGWSVLILKYGAETIVGTLGVKNAYLIAFLFSLFGGVSSFGGVAYVLTIGSLAVAGFNPVGLALASGAGVTVGDTIYFYLGHHAHYTLRETRFTHMVKAFTDWLGQKPKALRALSIYCYTAFLPLPTDILTIALGIARQPYFLVITSLVLGNITFAFLIALFAQGVLL